MMSRLSLADKLKILGDVTSSSGLFVVAIVILVALALLLIATLSLIHISEPTRRS